MAASHSPRAPARVTARASTENMRASTKDMRAPARASTKTMRASSKNTRASKENVRAIFARVAPYYDLMNDAMSLGLHRRWKARAVAAMHLERAGPRTVLDMACGSGDIAARVAQRAHPQSRLICVDNNPAMLALARQRLAQPRFAQPCLKSVRFVRADAASVPLADGCVDIYCVGFGLRNFAERTQALAEAHRLLRPGGHFLCLEFAPEARGWLGAAAHAWTDTVVPQLGAWLAQDKASYIYLRDSIRRFLTPARLEAELRGAGLQRVSHRLMLGGRLALHQGWKVAA